MPEQTVRLTTSHGQLSAFLATPESGSEASSEPGSEAGDAPRPGVIVLHELFGLNDDIRRITRRFAEHGYVALAPDLYSVGPRLRPICIFQTVSNLRRGEGRPFDLIEAARVWLTDHREVDASRMALAGFCLGGGFAMLYAARAPLGAAAIFYGQAPSSADRLQGICSVFGAYGEHDRIAGTDAQLLEQHLTQLEVEHEIKVYPQAGHSFMNQYSGMQSLFVRLSPGQVGYQREASEDAWQSMFNFFDRQFG